MTFNGFSPKARQFFKELEADNSKSFWEAHKADFEANVKAPFADLLEVIAEKPDRFKTFRMHRDIRFSKDKSPYKLMHGSAATSDHGSIKYTHIDKNGLLMGSGIYMMSKNQLENFRAAIDVPTKAKQLRQLIAKLEKIDDVKVEPGGAAPLKTAPRGYEKDHPDVDLQRLKGVIAVSHVKKASDLSSKDLPKQVKTFFKSAKALREWIDQNVGPA